MARKFGKFLFWAIIVCGAIAGGIRYFNKHKSKKEEIADDFEEITDEDDTQDITEREYVKIPTENHIGRINRESSVETEETLQHQA